MCSSDLLCPPWGVRGGQAAPGGWVTVVQPSGERERLFKTKGYPVAPGDIVIMEAGGGGGYGPPEQRARDMVRRDLEAGYISAASAAAHYGLNVGAGKAELP